MSEKPLARRPGEASAIEQAGPFDLTAMQMMAGKLPQLEQFFKDKLVEGKDRDWEHTDIIWKRTLRAGEDRKAALLDPGVAKILNYMQLRPRHRILEKEIDTRTNNLRYVVAVELVPYIPVMYHNPVTNSMEPYYPVVAEGVGSATTREKRYKVAFEYFKERDLRAQGWTEEEFKKFTEDNPADFVKGEPPTRLFYLPTAESLGADNTLLKMASKRCLGSTTPLLVKTGRHTCRTNASNLYDIYNSSLDPIYLPSRNGEWRKIIGMTREENREVINITLKSGEYIRATSNHDFPTQDAPLKAVKDLRVGDKLVRSKIVPPLDAGTADTELGWAVGLFLADGSYLDDKKSIMYTLNDGRKFVYISRLETICARLGCSPYISQDKNHHTMRMKIYGEAFSGLMRQFVNGDSCYNKTLSKFAWDQSEDFLHEILNGYLDGDSWESQRKKTPIWPLGFTGENYELQHDLRCLCAILNKRVKIVRGKANIKDKVYSAFRGWITDTVVSYNQIDLEEIESIELETKPAVVYDIDVDGDNIFLLASGIESHNSEMDAVFQLPGVAGRFSQEIDLKEDRGEEKPTTPPTEKDRSTPPFSAPPVAQGPVSTPPSTPTEKPKPQPSPAPESPPKPNIRNVNLDDSTEKTIAAIQEQNKGMSRAQVLQRIDEEISKAAGLLTREAAAVLVASTLGIKPQEATGFKSASTLPVMPPDFKLGDKAGYTADYIVENFGQNLDAVRAMIYAEMQSRGVTDEVAAVAIQRGYEERAKPEEPGLTADQVEDALNKAKLDSLRVDISIGMYEEGVDEVKPKRFLGDDFMRFNDALRPLGFEWHSDGRESRWIRGGKQA